MKHSFEAVSLLTTDNGMLEVTIIPAMNQPDWIIPSSLILSVDEHDEHIWTYLWQQQEVAVFHMLPKDQQPDKIIVLEGNTTAHRIGLQTSGELQQTKVTLSDIKDIELPTQYSPVDSSDVDNYTMVNTKNNSRLITKEDEYSTPENRFEEDKVLSYLFQTILLNDKRYMIPDLDKIAHQLVDLDS